MKMNFNQHFKKLLNVGCDIGRIVIQYLSKFLSIGNSVKSCSGKGITGRVISPKYPNFLC